MLLPHLLFSFLLLTLCRAEGGVDSAALGSLIARADNLLAAGQFADAARTYSEAIEQSPTSYLNYYKRATAYLSLNRHSPALEDFDTVLKLNGDFHKALFMKGKIYAKEGRWSEGRDMLKLYSKKVKGDRTVADLLFELSEAEVAAKKAVVAGKAKQYPTCIEQATVALQTAAYSASLRQLRVNCALASGDVQQAIGDLTRLTHLVPPSTPLLLAISTLSYYLLPASTQATASLKQCLHFDPDSKPCRTALRELKAFDKSFTQLDGNLEGSDWRGIINLVVGNPAGSGFASKFEAGMTAALDALKTNGAEAFVTVPTSLKPKKSSPQRLRLYKAACKAYVNTGEIRKSESWCSEVLKMDGGADDQDALVGMGEVALKKEEWEEAVRLFEKAFEASGRSSQDIHTRLDKARRLLKQSKAKDYYKVLGVPRDADARTIKKAYRKLAKDAHPDKGGSESKMAAVNEAYEVLSNDELRRRFDAGDDPNDPTSGQGGHPFPGGAQYFFQQGSPFGQFQGMPFGGQGGPFGGQGGFQFHWGG